MKNCWISRLLDYRGQFVWKNEECFPVLGKLMLANRGVGLGRLHYCNTEFMSIINNCPISYVISLVYIHALS